ncbi:MAG TPA: VOC family protein [Devosiaceae bacterium]|nr:VOC family protein [Devosiaceae bacterium]
MTAIDHIGISVGDFDKSVEFYQAVLGTLGIKLLTDMEMGGDRHAGFGVENAFFWVSKDARPAGNCHIAFTATNRADVGSFHITGLGMGGRDNGAPGVRPHYHAHYYAGFLLDPDGNNIEAVCHAPEAAEDAEAQNAAD